MPKFTVEFEVPELRAVRYWAEVEAETEDEAVTKVQDCYNDLSLDDIATMWDSVYEESEGWAGVPDVITVELVEDESA